MNIARNLSALLLVAVIGATGCAQREDAAAVPAVASPGTAGKVDPEDPKAGMNTTRPDSIKDVAPGADGNKPAP